MKAIKTILEVPPGMTIGDAYIEAVKYSATNHVNVEFRFNGKTYQVIFNDLFSVPKEVK